MGSEPTDRDLLGRMCAQPATRMSREEIESAVSALSDLLTVLGNADPADRAEVYAQLGLRLIYQPGERIVRSEIRINRAHWQFEGVRGGT
jgi:site-specific DNA recombinase